MSVQIQEVLVVAGDEQERQDLHTFLVELGLHPTVVSEPARALELAESRTFVLALIDADTPTPGAGIDLCWSLRRLSPVMALVLLSAYRSFDLAAGALRAGASDVVVKSADQIDYLRQRLLSLSSEAAAKLPREALLGESAALNEEFLRRLTDMARRVGELRDRVASFSGEAPVPDDEACRVLLVEDDGWLQGALMKLLPRGFTLSGVVSGGSALDKASGQRFHIALVRETLPDLPGRMVVRTLAAQSPDTITLLFSVPGERPGEVQVVEGSHMIQLVPEFREASQVAERLGELREAQRARSRERRYLATFREESYDLLRRYAELRQRLERAPL